ncbi:MAG TPA: septum formation initiator family protein, partial [Candidatus Binatia bacterium]|nr:septum formation initiator family protein [Candidatus Binatia bacterium]
LWRLKAEKAKLDQENFRLQKENEGLRQRISKLRNDNFYLEKIAREELNLVRPGEIIYRFPLSEKKENKVGTVSGDSAESRPSTGQKQPR